MEWQEISEEELIAILKLTASIISTATGAALLFHDAPDLGDTSTEKHPSPFHHWQVGVALMALGTAGIISSAKDLVPLVRRILREKLIFTGIEENTGVVHEGGRGQGEVRE